MSLAFMRYTVGSSHALKSWPMIFLYIVEESATKAILRLKRSATNAVLFMSKDNSHNMNSPQFYIAIIACRHAGARG